MLRAEQKTSCVRLSEAPTCSASDNPPAMQQQGSMSLWHQPRQCCLGCTCDRRADRAARAERGPMEDTVPLCCSAAALPWPAGRGSGTRAARPSRAVSLSTRRILQQQSTAVACVCRACCVCANLSGTASGSLSSWTGGAVLRCCGSDVAVPCWSPVTLGRGARQSSHPSAASRVSVVREGAGRKPLARGPRTRPDGPLSFSSAVFLAWMCSIWASMSWMPSSLTV